MNGLDREHLFDAELPEGAAPACAALWRLGELTRAERALDPPNADATERARTEARALYAKLLHDIAPFAQDDRAPSLGAPEELRARFADSVLLWMQFCKTSSVPIVDSV